MFTNFKKQSYPIRHCEKVRSTAASNPEKNYLSYRIFIVFSEIASRDEVSTKT